MKLSSVLENSGLQPFQGDPEITSVTNDSRQAGPGSLFFAMAGSRANGNDFIAQALEKGAAAVISAESVPEEMKAGRPSAVFLKAADLNAALSRAAANFYGHPSRSLKLFGLTGTKGKTTTAYLLESILRLAGARPGMIGTIDYRVDGKVLGPAANTTPFAHTLHRLLAEMVKADALSAVMEVSSHALALGRADDADFDVAAFTNLQSDHLDFHKDRESYFKAKARLFELLERSAKKDKCAVINADDERARVLIRAVKGKLKVLTFGIKSEADIMAGEVEVLERSTAFTLKAGEETLPVKLSLLGRHNVYNALAAIACAVGGGIPLRKAVEGAEALRNVPGRLERVEEGQDFTVFVDYAHTDAALQNVLGNLKTLPHARIITLFGCGGDRDRTKRAPMGRACCSMSDLVIVTTDNPRSEDPARILADIEAGIRGEFGNYEVVPDRGEAIARAIELAGKGDIVLLAGKGHETYQILKDRTISFSDAGTAAECLRRKLEGK